MAVRIWIWCSTLLMIYMPSLFVRRIYRERTVGSASIVPIFLVLANSHVWMLYGYLGRTWFPSFPVFLIGDLVSLCYLFIFWRYSQQRAQVAEKIGLMFAWLTVPTLYVTAASLGFTGQTRNEIWKTQGLCFCDVTVITSHMIMLRTLIRAFKQRSAATLVPRSLAVTTFNTLGWFTFGRVTSNWIIAGPQVFVIALHVAAWTMYFVYGFQKKPETQTTSIEEVDSRFSIIFSPKLDANAKEESHSTSDYQAVRSPSVHIVLIK
ncbi:3-like protein [Plasmopara halstedii]|uniref:3-like protein n=1 Tax=Plasmopara halstedii TaxID=4781 RepID=A0A0P1B4E2_PLAHL|nr:3-like protein [Plasmopara halstedii]CEG48981.1 3-like protein [Plasmopara halstedii]|eukprot:XP_024585350.1 3-like protein [Plasmopara halstedii]